MVNVVEVEVVVEVVEVMEVLEMVLMVLESVVVEVVVVIKGSGGGGGGDGGHVLLVKKNPIINFIAKLMNTTINDFIFLFKTPPDFSISSLTLLLIYLFILINYIILLDK